MEVDLLVAVAARHGTPADAEPSTLSQTGALRGSYNHTEESVDVSEAPTLELSDDRQPPVLTSGSCDHAGNTVEGVMALRRAAAAADAVEAAETAEVVEAVEAVECRGGQGIASAELEVVRLPAWV